MREAFAAAALPGERTAVHRRARSFAVELCDDEALARHAAFLGRHDEAAEAARRAVRLPSSPEALLATAILGDDFRSASTAALVTGRFALAADYAARMLDLAGGLIERADAYRQVALTRWRLGDVDGHRTNLEAAAKLTAEATDQGLEGARGSAARQLAAEAEAVLRTARPADAVPVAQAALDAAVEAGEPTAPAMVTLGTALVLSTGSGPASTGAADRISRSAGGARSAEAAGFAGRRRRSGLPATRSRRFSEAVTEPLSPIVVDRFSRVPRIDPATGGDHERGVALIRAGRLLAEQQHDLVTVGRAVSNLLAAKLPGAGVAAGWYLFDEASGALDALSVECHAGRISRLGYEHALRAGDLARAESLVWGRLPIETDPLERARFVGAAGLLAVERGDDALAARLLAKVNAERADVGQPWVIRAAAILALAIAARGTRADEVWRCFLDYLHGVPAQYHRVRPQRLVEAVRWALRGGVSAADLGRRLHELGEIGGRAGAQLRLLLAAASGADEQVAALAGRALAGPTQVAWQDAEVSATVAQALVRLDRADEARPHAERANALLHRWPGWRRESVEALLFGPRTGGDLTAREIEVLGCLAAGMSNQQVARSLGISIRTVAVHVSNLLRKTGAASRTEAALWAVRHQLAQFPGRAATH
jgi:DNA-binding NarL/FixJ family response regulator/uncharacterized membrane protein (UPF0136 family)